MHSNTYDQTALVNSRTNYPPSKPIWFFHIHYPVHKVPRHKCCPLCVWHSFLIPPHSQWDDMLYTTTATTSSRFQNGSRALRKAWKLASCSLAVNKVSVLVVCSYFALIRFGICVAKLFCSVARRFVVLSSISVVSKNLVPFSYSDPKKKKKLRRIGGVRVLMCAVQSKTVN